MNFRDLFGGIPFQSIVIFHAFVEQNQVLIHRLKRFDDPFFHAASVFFTDRSGKKEDFPHQDRDSCEDGNNRNGVIDVDFALLIRKTKKKKRYGYYTSQLDR